MNTKIWRWGRYLVLLLIVATSLACTLQLLQLPGGAAPTPTLPYALPPTPTPYPQAEITFRVQPPPGTTGPLVLAVLDEVTGLNIAPRRYDMTRGEDGAYEAKVYAPAGSVLKYRYEQHLNDGSIALEAQVSGALVRYRLLRVDGQMSITDQIARWNNTAYQGETGRIHGVVTDEKGAPLADILVSAGGEQAFTLADGSFLLENLPTGTHNLVAYAIDGRHKPFQQLAIVAANAATEAKITMPTAPLVPVQFIVVPPRDTMAGAPIRLAGNLSSLGNTFADLGGGLSTLANRMPVLQPMGDGRYTLTLKLPAGTDLRYKYTLGDGFWNAEHDAQGNFVTRQLLIPQQGAVVTDVVQTWASGGMHAVWFETTVPANTPPGDSVDIQLNPAVWTPPLPMWYLGDNKWGYLLSSPTNVAAELHYRFCRDEQCGVADEATYPGANPTGRLFNFTYTPQQIFDQVRWHWWQGTPTTNPPKPQKAPTPRDATFWRGVALMPAYTPAWQPYMGRATAEISRLQANWIVLTPTWTATWASPPVWEPRPGSDPMVADIAQNATQARERGLHTALFPAVRFEKGQDTWWQTGAHDFPWWVSWFDRYHAFARHFALVAQQTHADALVLGGQWVQPAILGNPLPNGEPSGAPADAEQRWRDILAEARSYYQGPIYWALPLEALDHPPAFLDAVDGIYLLWTPRLEAAPDDAQALLQETAKILDEKVKPLAQSLEKPIVLAVAYPSAKEAQGACVLTGTRQQCLPQDDLYPATPLAQHLHPDTQRQALAYEALLEAVNARPWIGGVVSADFYPPAQLQDPSASVHGKPASQYLGWWFGQWAAP